MILAAGIATEIAAELGFAEDVDRERGRAAAAVDVAQLEGVAVLLEQRRAPGAEQEGADRCAAWCSDATALAARGVLSLKSARETHSAPAGKIGGANNPKIPRGERARFSAAAVRAVGIFGAALRRGAAR